ncbi:alpha-amylase family glycosyl hydrolase, partial [Staphylococcus pseudintermedius]|uniref:alpha-amylase family glycosyl hydrolase n=1 Tax=Staphylococcus pseudintermedius TaxID=283734 RepID=UPI0022874362
IIARQWWKEDVACRVYPRSLIEAKVDGIGALRGLSEKLEYLQELGLDDIWLGPMLPAPNADHGFAISDYQAGSHTFMTMADICGFL